MKHRICVRLDAETVRKARLLTERENTSLNTLIARHLAAGLAEIQSHWAQTRRGMGIGAP